MSAASSSVYDVREYDFGIPDIQRHSQFPSSRTPETRSEQCSTLALRESKKKNLHERTRLPLEKIFAWKLKQISGLTDHAFRHTRFYRELYAAIGYEPGCIRTWDDFKQLPVVEKSQMIAAFPEKIVPAHYNPQTLHGLRTSGSNGEPLTVVLDPDRVYYDTLERYRMYEMMLGDGFARDDWIYSLDYSPWWFSSLDGAYRVFTVSPECPVAAIVEHIRRLRPRLVAGMADKLLAVASELPDATNFGVACFSTNSETSSRSRRRELARILGVPILDEYSSEELGLIAHECPFYNYHVCEDICHLELLPCDVPGAGEVVGTELWNLAQPTIRYRQGDLAMFQKERQPCECGSTFRRLQTLHGREDQALLRPSGERIAPMRVLDLCDQFLTPENSALKSFRIVQHELRRVELQLVKNMGIGRPAVAIQKFSAALESIFECTLELEIHFYEELPPLPGGKNRCIINTIDG